MRHLFIAAPLHSDKGHDDVGGRDHPPPTPCRAIKLAVMNVEIVSLLKACERAVTRPIAPNAGRIGSRSQPESASGEARGRGKIGRVNRPTTRVTQTTRLITWVIVGLIVLANLLYWFGPSTLRTDELVVIGLLIIGLICFQLWLRRQSITEGKSLVRHSLWCYTGATICGSRTRWRGHLISNNG